MIVAVVKAAIIGAAIGAALGVLDAAVTGRSIGKAAAMGAIGGAIGGGISAVAGPAISSFSEVLGKTLGATVERVFTIGVDVAKVGMSGVHVYRNIKNQEYFSLAFNSLGLVSATEDLVGNRAVENVESKAAKNGVDLKKAKEMKDQNGKGTGVFEASGNTNVFNPNSDEFKNDFFGQVKDWAVRGNHDGSQKRIWGLHVHDFEYVDKKQTIVKSFKFHYDSFPAASPTGVGLLLHGIDVAQGAAESSFLGLQRNIDKSNSVIYRAIDSQRFKK